MWKLDCAGLEVGLVAKELVDDGVACLVCVGKTVDDELLKFAAVFVWLTMARSDTQNGLLPSLLLRAKDARAAGDPPRPPNAMRRSCARSAL